MKKLLNLISLSLLLSMITITSCTERDLTAEAEAAVETIMQKYGNVGVAVAVVKDGDIIYNDTFGFKDLDKQTTISDKDVFRIASISKSFTSTALMQQVEKGLISLDDDVSDIMGFNIRNPKYPDTPITLKMLLSHTSSMRDAAGYFTLDHINPNITKDVSGSYHDWAPGENYDYCNLGYNLLGTILEKVSGVRFDKYVKENIFEALGLYGGHNVNELDASRFVNIYEWSAEKESFEVQPAAYATRATEIENYVMGYSTPIFSPTGGVKISYMDLAKYMTMHMNYGEYNGVRILKEESAKKMQEIVWHFSETTGYGLALNTVDIYVPDILLKGHTGSAYGLYSIMYFHPEEKWGVVAITNGCKTDPRGFQAAIVNEMYKIFIK